LERENFQVENIKGERGLTGRERGKKKTAGPAAGWVS
jgi:hypothetical protein